MGGHKLQIWALVGGCLWLGLHVGRAAAGMLAADLAAQLRGMQDAEQVNVIVMLHQQAALPTAMMPTHNRAERRQALIDALQRTATGTQPPLLAELSGAERALAVEDLRGFWIVNALAMKASKAVVLNLADRRDVGLITKDRVVHLTLPLPGRQETALQRIEWNIARIRAPEVWAMGLRGAGVVVASIDTGVFMEHPDLVQQYRGGTYGWLDAVNGRPTAYDDNGHGTHTIGTIVGSDAGGTAIGVAPEAQWIACKGLNAWGFGLSSRVLHCMQWMMDPDGNPATDDAPDVVNNSWSTQSGCFLVFVLAVKAWVRAGILPVFSVGNAGPQPRSGGSPAVYPWSFGVGATDSGDVIADFSGRGPSSCDRTVFPEVSAPGVNVRSSVPTGTCAFCARSGYRDLSGTSMAAPHVTGCVALMLSARERSDFKIFLQRWILQKTAIDLGIAGPDNIYGWGRIDCFAAVQRWQSR